jgi:hypothetical protein
MQHAWERTGKSHGVRSGDLGCQLCKDRCNFFLWGYVKDIIYRPSLPRHLQELSQRIITVLTAIEEDLLEKVWHEFDCRF